MKSNPKKEQGRDIDRELEESASEQRAEQQARRGQLGALLGSSRRDKTTAFRSSKAEHDALKEHAALLGLTLPDLVFGLSAYARRKEVTHKDLLQTLVEDFYKQTLAEGSFKVPTKEDKE